MNAPPIIDLGGACLRPLRAGDADALLAYLGDPTVTEQTAYPVVTPSLVASIIERANNRWASGELSKWGLAVDDRVVGTVGFNEWVPEHRRAELAYDLSPAHWGAGLMSRAVAAMLEWAFREWPLDRVHAYTRVDNRRSQSLLERGGFVREGCLRRFRVCRGTAHDFLVYGLLRPEAR